MSPLAPRNWDEAAHRRRVFGLLVLYRWLSLLPPLVALAAGQATPGGLVALAVAAVSNLLITAIPDRLNRLVQRAPVVLVVDLAFNGALLAVTGGWRSPFHLFTLSPILVSALFFHTRGALIAAAVFAPLSALAMGAAYRLAGSPPDPLAVTLAFVAYFLVGGIFGYAAALLARVREAHDRLTQVHRELQIIHDLTISLQNAPEVREVQQRVLEAVTLELGFRRAVVGLMDQPRMVLTSWHESGRRAFPVDYRARLPVEPGRGFVAGAILSNEAGILPDGALLTDDPAFDRMLDLHGDVLVSPMTLRDHPIGVLLVEMDSAQAGPLATEANLASLRAIAGQAAVALGTTMLCIDRAQRLAVQEERIRFAREIHDTVSQSLFGIAYALDGLARLLPDQPGVVKAELDQLRQAAEQTRTQVRQSILDIWPSALTAEVFQSDLRRFVGQLCLPGELELDIHVRGNFAALSPRRQRGLYRVAQEALANVAKHAGARHAEVRLQVDGGSARLTVRDDGRGFDPAQALARERDREHFGLRGIQQRAAALGGSCEFNSRPGHGATVQIDVPTIPQAVEADE